MKSTNEQNVINPASSTAVPDPLPQVRTGAAVDRLVALAKWCRHHGAPARLTGGKLCVTVDGVTNVIACPTYFGLRRLVLGEGALV